jgi:hypothetical protein
MGINSSSREKGRGSRIKAVASEPTLLFAIPVKCIFFKTNPGDEAKGKWADGLAGAGFLFAGA